ncbi:hypothetical protein BpHYR1_041833 [Brachionus plicatilis]|uniref:Uncharacterized protein n=1 Tax=Brachionus plicatilis TaxID=10195 RepID=A0A3M7RKI8_BRAPC|nr:hypothetical protein BpHYR1_041833 [Brachionus plicatilis]
MEKLSKGRVEERKRKSRGKEMYKLVLNCILKFTYMKKTYRNIVYLLEKHKSVFFIKDTQKN